MPTFDSTAGAALDGGSFAPAYFIFVDIAGDPVRATTFGNDVTFLAGATGDADLDGFTFSAVDPTILSIGDANADEGGSDTFTLSLSGLVTIDTALMAAIGATGNWRGRSLRVWVWIHDETGTAPQGAIAAWKTGYITHLPIHPSPEGQTIEARVENYLAAFTDPSYRSYADQKAFDAADTSAAATLSAANGGRGPGAAASQGGGSGGEGGNDGGGRFRFSGDL